MKRYHLIKRSYMGFSSYVSYVLDHFEGDFIIEEDLGELSEDTVKKIEEALGGLEITLANAPLIPLDDIDEGDRQLLLKALQTLESNEVLRIRR
ncbi:hypothetical protein E3E31_05730 [Thermococcus sp. M39]|uniref:hypothetical protein n=1 Tax=Thermococcus sp. M39 TaxID=1638262 RepID=UPI00143B1C1D|nr:hypothetical protein [Thermococcus sp. M39]NJE08026.1 hypothetical protein [Thermococcus sp. M39]